VPPPSGVRRYPALLRRRHIGRMYPEEPLPDDRLGYVLDVLGSRPLDAPGRPGPRHQPPLVLGAHDRAVVAQVIADLGRGWEWS